MFALRCPVAVSLGVATRCDPRCCCCAGVVAVVAHCLRVAVNDHRCSIRRGANGPHRHTITWLGV